MKQPLCWLLLVAAAGCSQTQPAPSLPPRTVLLQMIQGQSRDEAVTTLCRVIQQSTDQELRRDAVRFVASFEQAEQALPTLVKVLCETPDERLLWDITQSLDAIGADAALPVLSRAMADAELEAQLRIVGAIGHLGPDAAPSVSMLAGLLDSEHSALRIQSAKALARIGPAAADAVPALIQLLEAPRVPLDSAPPDGGQAYRVSRDLRHAVVAALAQIGPDATAVSGLRVCLAEEPWIASSAASALAHLGPAAADAVPELLLILQRNDHDGKDLKTVTAKRSAIEALGKIGPAAQAALPLLQDMLQQRSYVERLEHAVKLIQGDKGARGAD